MNPAKDGTIQAKHADSGMNRLRPGSEVRRRCSLGLAALALVCVGPTPAAVGDSGPMPDLSAPAAQVLANRAVNVCDEQTSSPKPASPASAGANRPVILTDQPADDIIVQIHPASSAQPPAAAAKAADVGGTQVAMADGQPASGGDGGQPQGSDLGVADVIASIDIRGQEARWVPVTKNGTADIELKVNIDRAEVADPNIADIFVASPRRVILTGKNYGTTQMALWSGEGQRFFNVSVEQDLSPLNGAIAATTPTARVTARSVNGLIVLTGTVPDAQTGERVAELAGMFQGGPVRNQLNVAGVQQTMLRVVVAEVDKDATRRLGFNWAIGASDVSRDFFFANNVNQLNPTVFGSNGLTNILAPNPAGQLTYSVFPASNGAGTNVTFGFPRAEFQVFMDALRENKLARVLAEPNLVAISGQTATFLAGGEVPIPVSQGGAVAGSITIDYKEFGVRLAFTPTVLGGQIVRLHIMSEVSEAVPGGAITGGLPVFSFTTRRVESTIECGNGQTFAIAGLLNERVQSVSDKIPGLGDLPVIGALFSSVNYQRRNTELVVLVTPQLVEPLDPQQVPPPPGALMGHPDDFQLFALGQLEGTPRPAPDYDRVPREEAPVNTPPNTASGWATTQLTLVGPWGLAEYEEN